MIEIPKTVTAGDSLKLSLEQTRSKYPTAEYNLLFVVGLQGKEQPYQVPENREFTISWRDTKQWPTSIPWRLYAITKRGADRFTVASGGFEVVQPFAISSRSAPNEEETPTHAEKVLEAIEAVLENKATFDQLSVSINGRTLMRRSLNELLDLRKYYRDEVTQEKAKAKNGGALTFGKIRLNMPRY